MKRAARLTLAFISACVIAGCSTGGSAANCSAPALASEGRISLAAGDALGTSIYINDVILAAAAAERQSQFANVPTTDAPAEK